MGRTWRQTGRFPMCHARPFTAGGRLYILGHRGNLGVCVSTDKGETWSEVGWLTKGQSWYQSACNVWYKAKEGRTHDNEESDSRVRRLGDAAQAGPRRLRPPRPAHEVKDSPKSTTELRQSPQRNCAKVHNENSQKSTTELTGCRLIWYFVCMKIYKRATKGIVMRLNAKRVMAVGGASVDNDLCMPTAKEQDEFAEDFLDGLVWKS